MFYGVLLKKTFVIEVAASSKRVPRARRRIFDLTRDQAANENLDSPYLHSLA
jgi:hypothetical protein